MKVKSTTLYCFSPPVMVATFVIESILMLYVLIRYKWNALTRLIASVLFLLATFQLAEYQVCSNGGGVSHASRIGFIAITLLPAIGIHIISLISSTKKTCQILMYFIFGYLVLLIPTGLVNAIDPRTINGIPSIMCGFALVYALVLAGGVAPLALKKRSYRSALIKKTAS
jgi:hypothetical protein